MFKYIKDLFLKIFYRKPVQILETKPLPQPVDQIKIAPPSETPWIDWMLSRLGWTEFDHDKELSVYWKYTNVPNYKSVIGSQYAWCALTVNAALIESGYKGTNNAAAISFADYGVPCQPKKGSIIVIQHPTGGHHVTTFDSWSDETKKIMRCLGGNQSNALRYSLFDVSGNKLGNDEVVACRWPVK